jgi:hypothetical protein
LRKINFLGQLFQLLLTKMAIIEQRISGIADATGNILTMLGGAGVGEVQLPEDVVLPLQSLEKLTALENLLKDDKEVKKKLVKNFFKYFTCIISNLSTR